MSPRGRFGGWLLWGLFLLGMLWTSPTEARDVRLAVLVGNQRGWKQDPLLRYALRGDLRPFARILRQLGFDVVLLQNRNSAALRRALHKVHQRVQRAPKVTTFLFYYTGHADKTSFHMGPKRAHPFTHKEFAVFLRKLPVRRRFAILDACFSGEVIRQFGNMRHFRDVVRKGVRRLKPLDISKNFPTQGDEQGLQIISSSLESAWESRRYRASIFTYHLLQGLQGPADRDNDGKISIGELFAYVSQAMARETLQKPYIFGIYRRARVYALAPAYKSRLWIGPKIVGRLRVSVANFFWTQHKRRQHALRLAVIPGKGTVDLRRGGRCWRQQIRLSKGREVRLSDHWRSVACQHLTARRKGSIELPAQTLQVLPPASSHQLEWLGGTRQMGLMKGALLGGGTFGWRKGLFGVRLGLWGTSIPYQDQHREQFVAQLQGEFGYRLNLARFDMFVGGVVGAGLLFQDVNTQAQVGGFLSYGATLQLGFWLSERFGLTAHSEAGFQLANLGFSWENRFSWQVMVGLCIRLDMPLTHPRTSLSSHR